MYLKLKTCKSYYICKQYTKFAPVIKNPSSLLKIKCNAILRIIEKYFVHPSQPFSYILTRGFSKIIFFYIIYLVSYSPLMANSFVYFLLRYIYSRSLFYNKIMNVYVDREYYMQKVTTKLCLFSLQIQDSRENVSLYNETH